jgi:hypothetical protein
MELFQLILLSPKRRSPLLKNLNRGTKILDSALCAVGKSILIDPDGARGVVCARSIGD